MFVGNISGFMPYGFSGSGNGHLFGGAPKKCDDCRFDEIFSEALKNVCNGEAPDMSVFSRDDMDGCEGCMMLEGVKTLLGTLFMDADEGCCCSGGSNGCADKAGCACKAGKSGNVGNAGKSGRKSVSDMFGMSGNGLLSSMQTVREEHLMPEMGVLLSKNREFVEEAEKIGVPDSDKSASHSTWHWYAVLYGGKADGTYSKCIFFFTNMSTSYVKSVAGYMFGSDVAVKVGVDDTEVPYFRWQLAGAPEASDRDDVDAVVLTYSEWADAMKRSEKWGSRDFVYITPDMLNRMDKDIDVLDALVDAKNRLSYPV